LGDPSLHWMVRAHLAGWDDDVVARVCAALRLTDPSGVGDDLLDGLADWFRLGAPHATDDDRYWWSVTLQVLEHAEYRAPEIAEEVRLRLFGEHEATRLMLASRLPQLAGDHGSPPSAARGPVHQCDGPRQDIRVGLGQDAMAEVEHMPRGLRALDQHPAHLRLDDVQRREQHARVEVALQRLAG